MAWGDLKCDCYYRLPGDLVILDYLLKNHGIDVPAKRSGAVQGITLASVPVLYGQEKSDSKEYVKQLTSTGFIPHFFDGYRGTWKVLDFDTCWQREDGRINDKTICIACIVSSGEMPFVTPKGLLAPPSISYTVFHNSARLTAYLMHKYKLDISTVKVTKGCSDFITSRWGEFKKEVRTQLKKL